MNDFDFLVGTWDVVNRRRTAFLDETSEWEEFPGVSRADRHFDGAANVDEIVFATKGFAGLTVRLYDPVRRQWALHWSRQGSGVFDPPVTGGFVDGRGDFFGDDTYAGTKVRVHFVWSDITADSARWQQAFSIDGRTWLTNWIMELTRRPS